jgi:hypothetical protein
MPSETADGRYIWFITSDPAAPSERIAIDLSEISDGEASTVGQWWNAVTQYLEDRSPSELGEFEGVTVGGWQLETRGVVLEALALDDPDWFSDGPYEELD